MKLNKKNLSIFLAVFALFTVSISPDVQAASSTQYTAADCISEQLLESTGGDKTHFPENLTAEDRAQLLDRIKADGRPILVVTDAYYGQKSGGRHGDESLAAGGGEADRRKSHHQVCDA